MMHLHQDPCTLHRYAAPKKNIVVSAQTAPHKTWTTLNQHSQTHAGNIQAPQSHSKYQNCGLPQFNVTGLCVDLPQLDHCSPLRSLDDVPPVQYLQSNGDSNITGLRGQSSDASDIPYPHVLRDVQQHRPHGMSDYIKDVFFPTDLRGPRLVDTPLGSTMLSPNILYKSLHLSDVTSGTLTVGSNSPTTANVSPRSSLTEFAPQRVTAMECISPLTSVSSCMNSSDPVSSPIGYAPPMPPLDYVVAPSLPPDCRVTSPMQPSSVNYAASSASGTTAAHYSASHRRHAGRGLTTLGVAAATQQREHHSPLRVGDVEQCLPTDRMNATRLNNMPGPTPIVGEPTTLMIRHIPYRYSQRDLIEDIRDLGIELGLHMDFFYLPIDPKTGSNLGYAFLNMTDKNALNKIWSLTGQRLPRFLKDTRKVLSVDVCSIQGYENNWRHYEGSSTMNRLSPERRPIFSQILNSYWLDDRQEDETHSNFQIGTTSAHHLWNWRPTTFMLQNIRNFYTQQNLVDDLQNMCQLMPARDIDYLYLPVNTQRSGNLGYAFIKFTNVQAQERFMHLERPHVPPFFQSKVTRVLNSVTVATTQGSFQNCKNWCKSSDKLCKHKDTKPIKEKNACPSFWGLSGDQLELEVHPNTHGTLPLSPCHAIAPPPGLEIVSRDDVICGPPGLELPPGFAVSASNAAPSTTYRVSDKKCHCATALHHTKKSSTAASCGA